MAAFNALFKFGSTLQTDLFVGEIEMDPEIENFLICKFTLQPILENCILHGMRMSDSKLIISVKIYSDEEIKIVISDNGNGYHRRGYIDSKNRCK